VWLTWRDLFIIITACMAYALLILPVFLKVKGIT
jgi:hypothetical protein